jgi:hypothetical protein
MTPEDSYRPTITSRLNAAWLRITGKDLWTSTTATVYSVEYGDLYEQINSEVGYYRVTYTYIVDGKRYVGRFVEFGRQDENYFKRDDNFVVLYNPHAPEKSYYPNVRTLTNFHLTCLALGTVLAMLALILYTLSEQVRYK